MLRDFPSGLTLAAVTGTLYALKMYLALLHWNFGDDACDLLVLVGIMLSATGFFGEFVAAARLNPRGHCRTCQRRACSCSEMTGRPPRFRTAAVL